MADPADARPPTPPDWATGAPEEVRRHLALALDVDDLVQAQRLAQVLRPWFGVAKVGLELYSAAGPEAVESMIDDGFAVFADLKLLDIPTTVRKAAKVLGSLGASYLTVHARDDAPTLRAGVEGFRDGALSADLPEPTVLAVAVLTSDAGAPAHVMPRRVALAAECGCRGMVCAADDLSIVRQLAPRLIRVVPGIRPAGAERQDQARSATPAAAVADGADLLVIGRAVTQAADPAAAAAAVAEEVGRALGEAVK
jgi:orotidine-5'-phosphate decarboxylase